MKHQKAIEEILSLFHASWMNEDDKAEMNRELLKAAGMALEQADADIEAGVQKGYSVEFQMELFRNRIRATCDIP